MILLGAGCQQIGSGLLEINVHIGAGFFLCLFGWISYKFSTCPK